MSNLIKKIFPLVDFVVISLVIFVVFSLYSEVMKSNEVFLANKELVIAISWYSLTTILVLFVKKFYSLCRFKLFDIYTVFESVAVVTVLTFILASFTEINVFLYLCLTLAAMGIFSCIILTRGLYILCSKLCNNKKNVLIVGAGQDGKLIAEEIQQRPELKLNVVGFLDDNMNNIEDEDSTIPILGLTCDSEAVIKDNNVKLVIVAVKSRMDSDILTDLVKGIPLGVKVWRMYRFYEKITHKFLVSKMSVNWLFYDCVRKKALFYAHIKRICDIFASIAILILTLPVSLIAMLGIKLSDFGPVFFVQMRAGKFGKPFKMIKFRSMYQDKVSEDFDDDVNEVHANDKRIMPFCKILRKFHIDEIPQMLNVLKGDMSIVGPRPVREEVNDENTSSVPFWECRNWVRPGWCGWQQVKINEPSSEQRLGYDLYYIKHRNLIWEISLFFRYILKIISGKGRDQ